MKKKAGGIATTIKKRSLPNLPIHPTPEHHPCMQMEKTTKFESRWSSDELIELVIQN